MVRGEIMERIGRKASLLVSLVCLLGLISYANTRTIESPFGLSADLRSEFGATFQVFSGGRIVIEASWNAQQNGVQPLRIALIRPDGSQAAQREGVSPLRLEYAIAETEADKFNSESPGKWNVKIINNAAAIRYEVTGKLRLTIPAAARTLEDTQYTLLGDGNAQEIPIRVIAPGRLTVEAEWQSDSQSSPVAASEAAPLTLSLEHPGMNRIFARRTARSPLLIEQQVTAADIERGKRLVVRLQNDNTTRVKGRVKVTFKPAL